MDSATLLMKQMRTAALTAEAVQLQLRQSMADGVLLALVHKLAGAGYSPDHVLVHRLQREATTVMGLPLLLVIHLIVRLYPLANTAIGVPALMQQRIQFLCFAVEAKCSEPALAEQGTVPEALLQKLQFATPRLVSAATGALGLHALFLAEGKGL